MHSESLGRAEGENMYVVDIDSYSLDLERITDISILSWRQ